MTTQLADWLEAYLMRTRELATVALAVVPLVLIYGLGLIFASPWARSGVDLISGHLLHELSTTTYVVIQFAIAVALVALAVDRRQRTVRAHIRWTLPSILEACVWGAVLGGIVLFLMDEVHLLRVPAELPTGLPQLATTTTGAGIGFMDRLVISAGAGLHEELLFRLLAVPLVATLLSRAIGVPKSAAAVGAILLSSLAFSSAHHLAGEPFSAFVFSYRLVAGLVFAALFLWRGFAITAWAHAAYDFSVL